MGEAVMLPAVMQDYAVACYRERLPMRHIAERLGVTFRQVRNALVAKGELLRPRGTMPGSKLAERQVVPYEDRLAKALAAEAKREAAKMARCRRRCACGGIISPTVVHRCGRVA